MELQFNKIGTTEYIVKGENPQLLIMSGTHGDEYQVIASVEKTIGRLWNELSDFLFIPQVSPSAVLAKTRVNENGLDINRNFFDDSSEKEIQNLIKIITPYHFDTAFTFHEDPKRNKFYIYDTGFLNHKTRLNLKKELKLIGIKLYNGVDDPSDPVLGYQAKKGYIRTSTEDIMVAHGSFEDWALSKKIISHVLNPEIPGRADQQIKDEIVEIIFRQIIIPHFAER